MPAGLLIEFAKPIYQVGVAHLLNRGLVKPHAAFFDSEEFTQPLHQEPTLDIGTCNIVFHFFHYFSH
jgi:hypothetical protein